MDANEIQKLVNQGESDRIEFKSSLSQKDKISQSICAFANDLPRHGMPGYVIIGLDDKMVPSGFVVNDEVLRNLASLRSDGNILPSPLIKVGKISIHGADVAVIEVSPSDSPPVRCKGVVWVSIGPTRRTATHEEERRLIERKISGGLSFDRQPAAGASISDLDLNLFRSAYLPFAVAPSVLDENSRNIEEQLVSLRFLSPDFSTPTNAGILVIGKDPQSFIPGSYLEFVRYSGDGVTSNINDHKTISGNLISLLSAVREIIPLQIMTTQTSSDGILNVDQPDYPVVALSELLFNAFHHRTYDGTNAPVRYYHFSGHVEISSPGGLYGQVNKDNIGRMTDYRNPVLAEAMKVLGYVQKFGIGIQKARAALEKNGNPPPDFTFDPTYVHVSITGVR